MDWRGVGRKEKRKRWQMNSVHHSSDQSMGWSFSSFPESIMTCLFSAEYPSKPGADSLCHPFSDYFWGRTLEVCTGFGQSGSWLPDTQRYLVSPAGSGWASLWRPSWAHTQPQWVGMTQVGHFLSPSLTSSRGGKLQGWGRQCGRFLRNKGDAAVDDS